jgi:hypothetical protein
LDGSTLLENMIPTSVGVSVEKGGKFVLEVHPRVAMQILRHSKIALTMELYTEVPSPVTRAALRKLGKWLDT